ncbi:hypothetical protein HOC80_03765 [archaeon]|jgi:uncharacterized protein|nr:hypothetical protein [archaeon]MBT4417195.1 hypothetical protein [archaeon]
MQFELKVISKPKLKDPVLIEGLPGIGNVGKIAADFLVENLKAKRVLEISSDHFPHSVFINEKNLVELPTLEIYHKKVNKQDILFLIGDVQPIDEPSCYAFCEAILKYFKSVNGKELVTLGGIGLQKIPKKPKVFITGNNKALIKSFPKCSNDIYGFVGPIIGVTGVLLGIATKYEIPSASLLTQTFAHPSYLGIKGAKETLAALNTKYKFELDLTKLTEEINEIEKEIKSKVQRIAELEGLKTEEKELNYFG